MRLHWSPYPAANEYFVERAKEGAAPFLPQSVTGTNLTVVFPDGDSAEILRLRVQTLSSNDLVAANLLNRLAYGPTPDELDRVRAVGPDAYIEEQLHPEKLDDPLPHDSLTPMADGWRFVTATGNGTSSSLYLYLTTAGEGYLDDLQLVAGPKPGVGPNLVRNGDFESPLTVVDWTVGANHAGSQITTDLSRSGSSCLHLRATEGGTSATSALVQHLAPALSPTSTYTVSFWWKPAGDPAAPVLVRLSGFGLATPPNGTLRDQLQSGQAEIDDLRAWHSLNAVYSRRQLLQILLQFLENHFVTQHSKSLEYFNPMYPNYGERLPSTTLEFNEIERWKAALLRPECTFHDLLRLSAESPAMIIYLDTVENRGDAGHIANENYARELLELFTFGVDNGYQQRDIEELARVWTGWSVRLVAPDQEFNPFARKTTLLRPGAPAGSTHITNLVGVWAFNFRPDLHDHGEKHLFHDPGSEAGAGPARTVPARFGPRYTGRPYGLVLPATSGTNALQEGYTVLQHLADQPFTQEYLVVKLCRLFVHDDFQHGVYDYATEPLSPEAALVKACMETWDSTEPKGQIRPVLRTLFDSPLFRQHGGSLQKIKTPLEFAVSTVRALMARRSDGAVTAVADGYGLRNVMRRSGNMDLFNRADPDGFPETAAPLLSTGTLAERIRFAQAFVMPLGYPAKADEAGENRVDPVAFVQLRLPPDQWRNAGAVTDLFLRYLFPAEGAANLAAYRQDAIAFLDTKDNGGGPEPFSGLSTSGTPSAYETRLRGMVALLLSLPRFQEQ
ncbi:MAG: DUF1800 family protein [Verrucomicrobiales bacterium]|nr:DUF1800 family protein [Verrucomicrobiales bacterium]